MKSTKDFRKKSDNFASEDLLKKATKLEPIKKSGKDKRTIYSSIDDEEEDLDLRNYKKRESILNYYDDSDDEDNDNEGEDDEVDEDEGEEDEGGDEEDTDYEDNEDLGDKEWYDDQINHRDR